MSYYTGLLDRVASALDGQEPLVDQLVERFELSSPRRLTAFLAQCGHESMGFVRTEENLRYSAERLRQVFGRYYPTESMARAEAYDPIRIANRCYSCRMGNGDIHSGDGFRYRGRGWIMLTGRDNYYACSRDLFGDDSLIRGPDKVSELPVAALVAGWFWSSNGLNELADAGIDSMRPITRIINGGYNGLEDRLAWYRRVERVLWGHSGDLPKPHAHSDRATAVPEPVIPDWMRAEK